MNKKQADMRGIDLRNAFSEMPASCQQALMQAARSVQEEKAMKHTLMRTIVIAALITLVLSTAAIAAGQLGLYDMFSQYYSNVILPKDAQEILSATQQTTYQVGPLSFTLHETLSDGHLIYLTTLIKPTDGSAALIVQANASSVNDPLLPSECQRLQLKEGTTFLEAAQQKHLPLYLVNAYYNVDSEILGAYEMFDMLYDQDGAALYVNMIATNPAQVPQSITAPLQLQVTGVDSATGKILEEQVWSQTATLTQPVNGAIETRSYTPTEAFTTADCTLRDAQAELTSAGAYITLRFDCAAAQEQELPHKLFRLELRDESGTVYPQGINLSGEYLDDNFPEVALKLMLGIEQLPDTLYLFDPQTETTVVLK